MILVVDFGSQLAHLITRRLKDIGVESTLVDAMEVMLKISEMKPKGIILSGGPASVYEADAPTIDPKIFETELPILGICYGWQLMAKLLDGKVKNTHKEYGVEKLEIETNERIVASFPKSISVVMSHGDTVTKLPPYFKVIGSTDSVKFAIVSHQQKKWFGVQFHPEAEHTEMGTLLLTNFATLCDESFEKHEFSIDMMIDMVKNQVGDGKVVCAVSGGVDSTVAAAVIAKAIGEQLTPVYVESGLMRPGTKERVMQIFSEIIPANLIVVNAKDRFMEALKNTHDPEEKRKRIGKLYVNIFNEIAATIEGMTFLAQGTIYSDVIESKGSKNAAHIKSHHNVGGLPSEMKLKLIEPLRSLYKDEVRAVGRLLNLPEEQVMQQTFPGPGYAIRIRGEVTEKRLQQEITADTIVVEEIKKAGLWEKMYQCFAVMTGTESTAVKGDDRAFAEVVAVRAYESSDVMTSRVSELPYEVIKRIAARIVNEVPDVSRVVYDITSKPPATMEWE